MSLQPAARMHRALRAAGVDAELHVLESCSHGGFMADAPEERELADEIRRFVAARLATDCGVTP
ncbi:hypothetical protein [Parafrankia soli]|uniref:hypothetical protein n=1 Tax=Parafrankia soli TaxID=2599596 RepID=UPI003B588A05